MHLFSGLERWVRFDSQAPTVAHNGGSVLGDHMPSSEFCGHQAHMWCACANKPSYTFKTEVLQYRGQPCSTVQSDLTGACPLLAKHIWYVVLKTHLLYLLFENRKVLWVNTLDQCMTWHLGDM